MRTLLLGLHAMLVMAAAGCGSDSPAGPTVRYARVAGTYAGPIAGSTEFQQMTGVLTLTLTQDSTMLRGSYSFTGMVTGGVNPGPVSASGALAGIVELLGESPPLTLTLYEPACGTHGNTVYAGYDSSAPGVEVRSGDLLICGLSDRTFHLGHATLAPS